MKYKENYEIEVIAPWRPIALKVISADPQCKVYNDDLLFKDNDVLVKCVYSQQTNWRRFKLVQKRREEEAISLSHVITCPLLKRLTYINNRVGQIIRYYSLLDKKKVVFMFQK